MSRPSTGRGRFPISTGSFEIEPDAKDEFAPVIEDSAGVSRDTRKVDDFDPVDRLLRGVRGTTSIMVSAVTETVCGTYRRKIEGLAEVS